jgi:hypothetical protein
VIYRVLCLNCAIESFVLFPGAYEVVQIIVDDISLRNAQTAPNGIDRGVVEELSQYRLVG